MAQRRDAWVQVVVVVLRVNVNLKAITFEDLVERRKVPRPPLQWLAERDLSLLGSTRGVLPEAWNFGFMQRNHLHLHPAVPSTPRPHTRCLRVWYREAARHLCLERRSAVYPSTWWHASPLS